MANYNLNSKKKLGVKINNIFPYEFQGWKGKDITPDKVTFTMLEPEELLFRTYEKNDKKIYLTIVLTNKRDHIHDPQVCYRGQGVDMDKQKFIKFGKQGINAYWVNAKKQDTPYNIVYWYTDLDKTYSSRYEFMKNVIFANIMNKPIFYYLLISISGLNVSNEELKIFAEKVNNDLFEIDKNK